MKRKNRQLFLIIQNKLQTYIFKNNLTLRNCILVISLAVFTNFIHIKFLRRRLAISIISFLLDILILIQILGNIYDDLEITQKYLVVQKLSSLSSGGSNKVLRRSEKNHPRLETMLHYRCKWTIEKKIDKKKRDLHMFIFEEQKWIAKTSVSKILSAGSWSEDDSRWCMR